MRIGLLGGLRVEHDGLPIAVSGTMQVAVLFRLTVDAGTAVSYRAIVEDVWGLDAPDNERAALQSVISRLRSQLPAGAIESTTGGYRLAIGRADVDALRFEDLVASGDPRAIEAWTGDPWIPSENFDWFRRDLLRDRASLQKTEAHSSVPAPLTRLVGRETELAMIIDQLAANRLVTIVGTGGAGKTRLAIETARSRANALLVELAPVGPGEVLPAILTATGRELRLVEAADMSSTRDRIVDALRGRDILLVLDNCEHVISEAALIAEELLGALPALRILATSREPLAIPGEAFVVIGSLPPAQAIELFLQRARSAGCAEPDVATAESICVRLDGLPLAIELAAAKLRTMALDEVAAGLEHRFTLLTGGYRTALPRHQTLRAMIDWSWSLLREDERTLLMHLAVFPAGIDAGDTACLIAALGIDDVFDSLVDRSLLQRTRGRFRTLETIREYGLDRLAETGRMADARAVQANHQAERATHFDHRIRTARIHESIAWFDAEEDNISAALRFATTAPLPEAAVRLASSCTWYWIIRDREEDARLWYPQLMPLADGLDGEEALFLRLLQPVVTAFSTEQPDQSRMFELIAPLSNVQVGPGSHDLLQLVPPMVAAFATVGDQPDWMLRVEIPNGEALGLDPWPTAVLHVVASAMAQNRGDLELLGRETEAAVAQFEVIGDLWGLAIAQQMRSEWLLLEGRLDEALVIADASTENLRRITPSWDLAQQQGLGISVLVRTGRLEEARERTRLMAEAATASGNSRTLMQAAIAQVTMDTLDGDAGAAREHLARLDELVEASPAFGQLGAWVGVTRARVALLEGDTDAAEAFLRDASEVALASHDQPVIAMVSVTIGSLAVARGDLRLALQAVDVASALIGAYDATNPEIVDIERAAANAGIGRAGAEALTRPMALEAMKTLVD
jgi:predicted ATPase